MNEEQRLASKQIKQPKPEDLKSSNGKKKELTSEEMIAKYFGTGKFQPPNLKQAKKRGKEEIKYHQHYEIPEEFIGMGKGKKFVIRTYGCA